MENSLKDFLYFNKKKVFIFTALVLMILGVGMFYIYDKKSGVSSNIPKNSSKVVLEKEEIEKPTEDKEDISETPKCFFDIKGEVKKPGVYEIECNKRIIDAINLSGGLTDKSDTSVLNLSKKIEDGMVIIIYSKTEVKNYLETVTKEKEKTTICNNGNIVNDACVENNKNSTTVALININTATLNELMTLSGIGESKAKNIISYRQKTPFKSKDDLLNVEGIGESLYASIKENITV